MENTFIKIKSINFIASSCWQNFWWKWIEFNDSGYSWKFCLEKSTSMILDLKNSILHHDTYFSIVITKDFEVYNFTVKTSLTFNGLLMKVKDFQDWFVNTRSYYKISVFWELDFLAANFKAEALNYFCLWFFILVLFLFFFLRG